MKARELRPCDGCGRPLLHAGVPLFWRVRIDRMGVDLAAARRRVGFETMMGGHTVLAEALGPDEDIARSVAGETEALVCESCAVDLPVAAVAELADRRGGSGG